MTALCQQLKPCGPIIDAKAAARVRREVEGRAGPLLDAAWPALEAVFAASPYLAGLARRDPEALGRILTDDPEARLAAILSASEQAVGDLDAVKTTLRRNKRELHLLTALCDLGGVWDLNAVTGALTRFADAALLAALATAVREEVERGRMLATDDPTLGPAPGLFCLALGKHGAFELNYSSDIDFSVFFEPDRLPVADGIEPQALALRLTQTLAAVMQERTAEGYVFRVDLRLRPDPSSTPAAIPVEAALDYYESVGQNWERAAMIKARVCAGDVQAGEGFVRELHPFVWRRHLDYAAISDIQSIKQQIHVHRNLPEGGKDRLVAPGANLKLGPGGIREIEFYAQTQQLIFGGRDPGLRSPRTLDALKALREAGHVSTRAETDLAKAYNDLRALEHRVQMIHDEQTHVLPAPVAERRRVAALAGYSDVRRFDASVAAILKRVNARYGALFAEAEPLSSMFGSLVFTGVDEDPETLLTLARMGFSHPAQVSAMIRGWHHGRIAATRTERARELFTRLAPRLLDAAAATGAPDAAFNRFADFFTGLSSGVQIQSLFLSEPKFFAMMVEIMAFAPRLASTLARKPAVLDALLGAHFFDPLEDGEAEAALTAAVDGEPDFEGAMDAARRIHREQAFRIGVQVMIGAAKAGEAGRAHAALADASIAALSAASLRETERMGGLFPGVVAVVALGKAGSREMTARSDLDLMTLYDANDPAAMSATKGWGAETFYARFTQRLVTALSSPTAEGELYPVDLRLRPSGSSGPVAVRLSAFESYYEGEAEFWEFMALTRARVVWASDPAFAVRAESLIAAALRRPREARVAAKAAREMRLLMAKEKPAAHAWDLKLQPGGLIDIEFAAQTLQLIHAPLGGPLEVNTGEALTALHGAGLLDRERFDALMSAWSLQQALDQVIKVAMTGGADPREEPARFGAILAKAGGVRSFAQLETRLSKVQAAAHGAFRTILADASR